MEFRRVLFRACGSLPAHSKPVPRRRASVTQFLRRDQRLSRSLRPPQTASYHRHPAVDVQGLTGHVTRLLARQIHHSGGDVIARSEPRSEEHTSELQSLMRISYAVFCLKKKNK